MIRLTDDYVIEVDNYNYALYRDYGKNKKNGSPMRKALGYFGTMQELLDYWAEISARNKLMEQDEISLAEAVGIVKQELETVRTAVRSTIPDVAIYPDKSEAHSEAV